MTTDLERKAAHELSIDINRMFAKMVNDHPYLATIFPSSPGYRYWGDKKIKAGAKRYCYSTQRVSNGKGKQMFASWVYVAVVSRKVWKLTKVRYHAKKKDAMARAAMLREESVA